MTREEKELLIKDLSARLPYGVKIRVEYPFLEEKDWRPEDLHGLDLRKEVHAGTSVRIEEFKPYLRPMSSMTKEEKIDYERLCSYCLEQDTVNYNITTLDKTQLVYVIDLLNKNHFDYRGLIKKGLAIDATGLNIY